MTSSDQIVERTRIRLRVRDDGRRASPCARDQARRKLHSRFARLCTAMPQCHRRDQVGSPSACSIVDIPDVESIARDYASGGASRSPSSTGRSFSRLGLRSHARSPRHPAAIMKDFIVEPSQLMRGIAAGADAILLLASLLDARRILDFIGLLEAYGCDALVEVHDEQELERAVEGGARLIGVNNRDLRDFRVDLGTSERLGALMPGATIRVAESGIRNRADVERLRTQVFTRSSRRIAAGGGRSRPRGAYTGHDMTKTRSAESPADDAHHGGGARRDFLASSSFPIRALSIDPKRAAKSSPRCSGAVARARATTAVPSRAIRCTVRPSFAMPPRRR